MDKVTECTICYDLPLKEEDILPCGHRVHISCVQKQFKAECPLCRTPLKIKVFGTKPHPDESLFLPPLEDVEEYQGIVTGVSFMFSLRPGILGNVIEYYESYSASNEENDEEPWRARGYQYAEEDPEYDEENPRGDNWNYEDI